MATGTPMQENTPPASVARGGEGSNAPAKPPTAAQQQGMALAELEHLIGYQQEYIGTVYYHPTQNETVIYTAGAAVVIEDVNDPHNQEFLRGHDADVCALHLSDIELQVKA